MKPGFITPAVVLLLALLIVSCSPTATQGAKTRITIVDSAGREIEVPQPLERIVILHGDGARAIRALGAEDRIVGISKAMAQEAEFWPRLRDKPVVGNYLTPNFEAIAALNPQLVVTYSGYTDDLEEKLRPAGIVVAALDCYKPESQVADLRTLGVILGTEARAAEFIAFLQMPLNEVQRRVSALTESERKRVYFETWVDYRSVAEGSGWHDMIVMAGGVNVFAGAKTPYHTISPEAVLANNPQIIVKMPSGQPYSAANADEMTDLRRALMSRPGWSNLDAVKNGQIYILSQDLAGGVTKPIAIAYLAKWLYPEKFRDIDPTAMLREYIERFQGMPYRGVFVYAE